MPYPSTRFERRSSAAFSLVEVVLALGLVSFALLALMGMIPVGLRQHSVSTEEVRALELITAVASDICNSTETNNTSKQFKVDITAPSGNGGQIYSPFYVDENFKAVSNPSEARYSVAVTYTQPATNTVPAYMRVVVAWPGSSATFSSTGPGGLSLSGEMGSVEALVARTWP